MTSFESIRASYRPRRISTLFVGESAPHGGTFFYNQDSGLFREMRTAFGGDEGFLHSFQLKGFFLDDLVLEPVNHLDKTVRRAACQQAIASLAARLKKYDPEAIVVLLCRIEPMVIKAMRIAGITYDPYCTPYPGFGNQPRFRSAMSEIIPKLPTISGANRKEVR